MSVRFLRRIALVGATGALLFPAAASATAPPPVSVRVSDPSVAAGRIFVAPKLEANTHTADQPTGPLILRPDGRADAFLQLPGDKTAFDFRPQRLGHRTVYTWWEGSSINGPGHGQGVDVIADRHLRPIARLRAGNGLDADQHEFRLTDRGTALITSYPVVERDLTSVGGPANGKVFDGVVQEIDVRTGRVRFQWSALDHVPLDESHQPLPADPTTTPWDYFHVNAVNPDEHGGLLVDSRHTWTVYDVDRRSGDVRWRLGGKRSDFELGPGAEFRWQHNPLPEGRDRIRIFDNHAADAATTTEPSRVIVLRLRRGRATLVRSYPQPEGLTAQSQGNAQRLPNGNLFVGWGSLGRFSEFARDGKLLYDAKLPDGYDTYRAYKAGP